MRSPLLNYAGNEHNDFGGAEFVDLVIPAIERMVAVALAEEAAPRGNQRCGCIEAG